MRASENKIEPDLLVVNRLPDCDVDCVRRKRRERGRERGIGREGESSLSETKPPLAVSSSSFRVGGLEKKLAKLRESAEREERSSRNSPRMDEEVDAVLDARATGA